MSPASVRLRRGIVVAAAVGALVVPLAGATAAPQSPPGSLAAADRSSPSPSPSPSGGVVELTPAVQRQLDDAVQQVMKEANVPGVSVGVWTPTRAST